MKSIREIIFGPLLKFYGKFAPSDRLLWPISRIILKKRKNIALLKAAEGFSMRLNASEYPDGSMYFGVFEVKTVQLIKSTLCPGDVAIDMGANIGYMSMIMAKAVGNTGKVISFEPMDLNLQRLSEAVALNGFSNVQIEARALGEYSGQLTLYSSASTLSFNHGESSIRRLDDDASEFQCEVTRLDDVNIPGRIKLMKIDIEGSEISAIKGAESTIRDHHPHIIVEYNPYILSELNYRFSDIHQAILSAREDYDAILLTGFSKKLQDTDITNNLLPHRIYNVWYRPINS